MMSKKQNGLTMLVVLHKPCALPPLDACYQPLQVGEGERIAPGYLRDNTGENISGRNATWCELTGLYWAWKNLDADAVGLCHYRRYMGRRALGKRKEARILTGEEIQQLLSENDVVLPTRRHYWIETRESQYAHAHHIEDLRRTEEVLREKYPEYLPAWQWMLGTRSGHICNMFIMRRELMEAYCGWLFDILFEVERRLDISGYEKKDQRVFGYLAERLLDVWIRTKGLRAIEAPMINTERQHWIRKGATFIGRKLHSEK